MTSPPRSRAPFKDSPAPLCILADASASTPDPFPSTVDQVLELPERVTVSVGRNDAGKTGLLNRLIDQHLFERVTAPRHQVIDTTHFPFMLDWTFPQRIRVLERDPVTRRT
jgi:hypothetical protein